MILSRANVQCHIRPYQQYSSRKSKHSPEAGQPVVLLLGGKQCIDIRADIEHHGMEAYC